VSDDVDVAVRAVRAGAVAALAVRDRARTGGRGALGVEVKGSPADFVSRADTASEAAIVALLEAERPGDGILGEEGASAASENARRWVIDGIDGTFNFLSGIPHWCVAVGLEEDGEPVAAAVYDPTADELFAGGPDRPTTLNGAATTVRTGRALDAAAVATFLERDVDREQVIGRLAGAVGVLRAGGAGTLELAWVAAGRVDAWAQPHVAPWDWIPGAALVRHAGGAAVVAGGDPAWHLAGPPDLVVALEALVPRG
jgi:myo-inositol-1(or 4)-monophosphatase